MRKHPLLYSAIFILLICFFLGGFFFLLYFVTSGSSTSMLPLGDIAVVKIEGPIFDSLEILRELERYKKSRSIKALVLRIDSPGGAVAASQEIFEEVKKIRRTKKIVVSMGTVAASGAYYIASAADRIIASPGTVTGSIGVIMENFGFQELIKLIKVENRVIKSGHYKDVANPFREMTEEEKVYLQQILDNMYGQFKKAVAGERKIPPDKIDSIAEGKIFTGEQAKELGLVDGLGNLYDAIEEAKKLAGLPEDARVVWPREEKFPFDWLISTEKFLGNWHQFMRAGLTGLENPQWLYFLKISSISSKEAL